MNKAEMGKRILVGGRRDGIGCRICCFFASKIAAEERNMELRFVWPRTEALRNHRIEGDITDIFPESYSVTHLIEDDCVNLETNPAATRFDRWYLPDKINAMREVARGMVLAEHISVATKALPVVDYSVHARLGDVLSVPLFFGSTKLFPRSGYIHILRKISEISGSLKVFLATDDASLAMEGKEILPRLITEHELLETLGLGKAKEVVKLWLIASQLSNSKTLICPTGSGFSMLAKIIHLFNHVALSPGEFTGLEDVLREMNLLYGKHALSLLDSSIDQRVRFSRIIRRNIKAQ